MAETKTTRDLLTSGLKLAGGQAHTLTVTRPTVRVTLSWPEELVNALPQDAALVLKGQRFGKVEMKLADAARAEGHVSVKFSWPDDSEKVSLHANAAGNTVELWKEQTFSSPDAPRWETDLADLVALVAENVSSERSA